MAESTPEIERLADAISRVVDQANQDCAAEYRAGGIREEPAFTERFATRLQDRINNLDIPETQVRASIHSLSSHGSRSEEKPSGADLVAVLDIDAHGRKRTKGLLVQAKRLEPNRPLGRRRYKGLTDQCAKMAAVSPESYVFVYSKVGVRAVTAKDLLANPGLQVDQLADITSPSQIFRDVVLCTKGDPSIGDATERGVGNLLRERGIPFGLVVKARMKLADGIDPDPSSTPPPAPRRLRIRLR